MAATRASARTTAAPDHDVFLLQCGGADEARTRGDDPEDPDEEEEACDAAEDDACDGAGGRAGVQALVLGGDGEDAGGLAFEEGGGVGGGCC